MTAAKARAEEIEEEVEETRSAIDETLAEIEHRLTPGQLLDQGLRYFREPGRRGSGTGLGEIIARNPLPVVLIGAGLAWLAVSGASSRRTERHERDPDREAARRTVAEETSSAPTVPEAATSP